MHPVIIEEDIRRAERVLFGKENVFDDEERIPFIINLDTIDLQAVPGSGKTTALLAKLLILSKNQPFSGGEGILVLSHTNTAVNQIKAKLNPYCPNLFLYPNFVGTIQSFVDIFLAIPCFESIFGYRPDFIDAETYKIKITNRFNAYIKPTGYSKIQTNNARNYLQGKYGRIESYRFDYDSNAQTNLIDELNGKELTFDKPKRHNQKIYNDFTLEEKQSIRTWLISFKIDLWNETRILHYDDAYYFANCYLHRHPMIKKILKRRFGYVFVDEMQDMDVHQVKLLDKIFYDEDDAFYTFQRIGDKNQAIFSYEVKLDDVWQDRPKILRLSKSMRLSNINAHIIEPFALHPIILDGKNEESNKEIIQPRIIVYKNDTITKVIIRFAQIIKQLQATNELPVEQNQIYKAIGWRKYTDEEHKIIVKNYFPNYNTEINKMVDECACFEDMLLRVDKCNISSKTIYDVFIKVIIKVLDIEKIKCNGALFTKSKLIEHIQNDHKEFLPMFKLYLFRMTEAYVIGDLPRVKALLNELINILIKQFQNNIQLSQISNDFIMQKSKKGILEINVQGSPNVYQDNGLKITVGTVHSVKGETHNATLYMETFYYSKYESERLIEQLIGTQIPQIVKDKTKQSARMIYVGFSRPTHLLCFAAHIDRIHGYETDLEKNGWIIDKSLIVG